MHIEKRKRTLQSRILKDGIESQRATNGEKEDSELILIKTLVQLKAKSFVW